jgi:flagellar hook-basal body complex protein FliE
MTMNISSLAGLPRPQVGVNPTGSQGVPAQNAQSSSQPADFSEALKEAVGALGELNAQADASTLKLATGSQVDIHEVMLNMEQASLGLQAALQVRNKLVDAYQEIMRMSI